MGPRRYAARPSGQAERDSSDGMVVEESRSASEERVRLTDVNPHLVCVLCHGYFVDATTITECLHSFCRSCIFRHLETKPFCPICEVQVHTRLHRSLKADKTLQDIVYKLVPGLFHNEMERRRQFYKLHPHRDEHLEPERRGVGLDRLIYSPSDTISLSLEFYDNEREKEEWSAVTSATPQRENTTAPIPQKNNSKRYLQCPAEFKMAHLKKFIRQKYNLSQTAEVEIIYKRESLPDTYSLMDVAYIYTWKRNGPMRFYYRLPGIVDMDQYEKMQAQELEKEKETIQQSVAIEDKQESETSKEKKTEVSEPLKISIKVEQNRIPKKEDTPLKEEPSLAKSKQDVRVNSVPNTHEKVEKIILSLKKSPKKDSNDVPIYEATVKVSTVSASSITPKPTKSTVKEESSKDSEVKGEKVNDSSNVKLSKQDELPVSVLLSLGQCRVGKTDEAKSASPKPSPSLPSPQPAQPTQQVSTSKPAESKSKSVSNARMSLNRIANELQQRAAINGMHKQKEDASTKAQKSSQPNTETQSDKQQIFNFPDPVNNKPASPNKTKKPYLSSPHNMRNSGDIGVMDQRIQQLYRTQGLVASQNNNNNNSKQESRLASWLNNRFQSKPSPTNGTSQSQSSLGQSISSRLNSPVPPTKTFKNIAPKLSPNDSNLNSHKMPPIAPKVSSPDTSLKMPSSLNKTISPKSPLSNGMLPPKKPAPKVNSPKTPTSKCMTTPRSHHNLPPVAQMSPPSPVTVSLAASVASVPLVSAHGATVALAENISMPGNATPRPTINYFVPNFNSSLPSVPILGSPVHVPSYGLKSGHGIVYAPMVGITRNFDNNKIRNGFTVANPESEGISKKQPETPPPPPEPIKSPKPTPESATEVNKSSPLPANGSSTPPSVNGFTKEPSSTPTNRQQVNGKQSKVDEEVNKLKRKLEELKKMNDGKSREVAGCQITKENPDSGDAKRRRDTTPVVSIELMRGKRPVPGLKAIQEVVELGKRKANDEKKTSDKKLKLSTKKDSKGDETNALDLSRCGAPPQNPAMPHWFKPMVNQYLSSNK